MPEFPLFQQDQAVLFLYVSLTVPALSPLSRVLYYELFLSSVYAFLLPPPIFLPEDNSETPPCSCFSDKRLNPRGPKVPFS